VDNDVRQTEIHATEPLVPDPSAFEFGWLFKGLEVTNHQVLAKFQHNLLKQ
jgi:hypothetical protein